MEMQKLSIALGDSLDESVVGCICELAEVGLDQVMDEGLLKEVPFISTAVSLYKIGCSIRERNYIQKLVKLYLAYLDEEIIWEELTMYAENYR